jgi:hypothetical protein
MTASPQPAALDRPCRPPEHKPPGDAARMRIGPPMEQSVAARGLGAMGFNPYSADMRPPRATDRRDRAATHETEPAP